MADVKIGTERTWFSWAVLAAAVALAVVCIDKFNSIEAVSKEQFSKLDTRAAVLETNSGHANDALKEIGETLKTIASKQDGEREKIGNHEGRITLLEERVGRLEAKADGK